MDKLDDVVRKLADAVPGELKDNMGNMSELRGDMERNFRALLNDMLDKLELVTREEFEVQRKVLERTREKLDLLERELAALQADTNDDPTSND